MLRALICAVLLSGAAATAQETRWDVGVIGGYGFANNLTVTNATSSVDAGTKNGGVFGVYGGEDTYRYFSGEASYLYRDSAFKLDGHGQSASLDGHTHIITGDILAHFRPRESRLRPFVSFGGGIKILVGTGAENASQPLGACAGPGPNCFAALTATRELIPVGDAGIGFKYQLSRSVRIRVQIRDYISGRPQDVIAVGPGARFSGIFNDFIGTGSVGFTW